jgi:hypothetical protein
MYRKHEYHWTKNKLYSNSRQSILEIRPDKSAAHHKRTIQHDRRQGRGDENAEDAVEESWVTRWRLRRRWRPSWINETEVVVTRYESECKTSSFHEHKRPTADSRNLT